MKVTATTTNTTLIYKISENFFSHPSLGWDMMDWYETSPSGIGPRPYGAEELSYDTDPDGSWFVFGISCEGNSCLVRFEASKGLLTVEIASRRHALHDHGNMGGSAFLQCFGRKGGDGHFRADARILSGLTVQNYDSWRKDSNFWDCDLQPLLCGKEYARAKAEGRV